MRQFPEQNPIIVRREWRPSDQCSHILFSCQRLSAALFSTPSEVLWNFGHFPAGERRLSLSENPQFYRGLPLSSSTYKGDFESRPVENCQDKVYVLTSSPRKVFLDRGSQVRIFDNVWDMNGTLIFKSS